MMYLLFFVLFIVLIYVEASFDGYEYNYRRRNTQRKEFFNFKLLFLFSALLVGYVVGKIGPSVSLIRFTWDDFWYLLVLGVSYSLIRYAIFNLIFNLTTGLDWYYIGTSKWFERMHHTIIEKTKFPPVHFWTMLRIICLCIAFGLLRNNILF